MKYAVFIWFILNSSGKLYSQILSDYQKQVFTSKVGSLPYRILYPENFDPVKKYPLVLFLHGRGESGSNNESQLINGGKLFLQKEFRTRFPCVVVFPQCPEDSYWANVQIDTVGSKRFFSFIKGGKPTKAMSMLGDFIKYLSNLPFTDQNRIYAGGLSMGGMGTLELLRRSPGVVAAAFAICGGDNPDNARKYAKTPLWIFHGGLDDVVSPQFSFWVVKRLKELGADPKFTIYPKANHNSWDSAFNEKELFPWLFSNTKN